MSNVIFLFISGKWFTHCEQTVCVHDYSRGHPVNELHIGIILSIFQIFWVTVAIDNQ